MRILGVDPGSRVTGWGVVDASGWEIRFVAHGVIRAGDEDALGPRLVRLAQGLRSVIAEHGAEEVAIENVFTAKNARSALVLGHARGVLMLAATEAGLPLHEYTPMQVKNAVTGAGRAEKEQVRAALTLQLGLTALPRPLDASDALAIAICHASVSRLAKRLPALLTETPARGHALGNLRRNGRLRLR